jgi:rod shape-determining protein MreB and related proteins
MNVTGDIGFWRLGGLGIDLGTANTVVCHPLRGVVLNEPSMMALRSNGHLDLNPVAVGSEARDLVGRTPAGIVTTRPLSDGVVTDLETARSFIVAILRRLKLMPWERIRTHAVIGVPACASALERRALLEAAVEAGIRRVTLIPEPVAGAIGSGIDPLARRAQMVVDVGGGTAEITAFCFGGILASASCRVAGDEMTMALYQHLRLQHEIVVGELTAEDVKVRMAGNGKHSITVEGRDGSSGRPRTVKVSPDEVAEAIRPISEMIVQTLVNCLEELPPQAVGDVLHDGILAFGGGSLAPGFDRMVEEAFGIPVRRAERPLTCVAEGAAQALRSRRLLTAFSLS